MKEKIKQKSWIVGCTVFLLILGYLFIHVSYLMRPTKDENRILPGFYAEPKNSLDMLYIGGSACFMYWMPITAYEHYGITSYNVGSSAMDLKTVKFALKEALKTQSPSLILIDARPFQYGDSRDADIITEVGLRNFTDRVRYSLGRTQYIRRLVPSHIIEGDSKDTFSYIFDIAKYHTRWTELNELSWRQADCYNKYETMGYVFLPVVDPTLQGTDYSQITQEVEPSKILNIVLMDLLEYCSQCNSKILFIANSYIEDPVERMGYNYLKRVVEQYDNIDFVNINDFNQQIGLEYSMDFADRTHVNAFGAEKYTIFLGQYIKDHYPLPDRRQDEQAFYWNEMIPKWKQILQANKDLLINLRNQAQAKPAAQ